MEAEAEAYEAIFNRADFRLRQLPRLTVKLEQFGVPTGAAMKCVELAEQFSAE